MNTSCLHCARRALGLVVIVLAAGGFLTNAIAADAPRGQPSKVAASVQRVLDRIDAADTATDRKQAAGAATAAPQDLSVLSDGLVKVRPTGEVEVVLHAKGSVGDAEEAAVRALGAEIVITLKTPGMIQAWIPAKRIAEAAKLPWVAAVTPPDYGHTNPHPTNPINSEGVTLHNADIAQAQGVNGTGVTVGAISNGVANLAASQARNELPAVNVISAGSGDEGTAMLEIVHDMAPGAALAFHASGSGTAGHVTAVQNLVAAGVNVIAEDLAFDAQPAFQQGVVANAREAAAIAGVSVHSSSGNRGQNHTARVAAVGTGGGPDGKSGAVHRLHRAADQRSCDRSWQRHHVRHDARQRDELHAAVERAARDLPDGGSGRVHQSRPHDHGRRR